ncbi:MAG: ABC transporter permease, partial [Chloroflexota bacterium]
IIIDENIAQIYSLNLGDKVLLRTVQGTEEEFFSLRITGITDEQQYLFSPSVFLPLNTWDEVRPKGQVFQGGQTVLNTVILKLEENVSITQMLARLNQLVDGIEVADKETLIRAQPGYSAQQSTVNAQKGFALLIGVLVLGGFFQIQTVQKIPQIGMLKAIGASNKTVAASIFTQIIVVTLMGVALGSVITFLLAVGIPDAVPLQFTLEIIVISLSVLIAIGPIGGVFSIRMATKVEPLIAMGL